jgi:hypothetical protein
MNMIHRVKSRAHICDNNTGSNVTLITLTFWHHTCQNIDKLPPAAYPKAWAFSVNLLEGYVTTRVADDMCE